MKTNIKANYFSGNFMCTFWSSFPVLTATVTRPNIRRKTNPNVLYRKAALLFLNLGTCSWKQRNFNLRYMLQHKRSSQNSSISSTQMNTSATSQISSDPQLTFFRLNEQTFWPFFSIHFHAEADKKNQA